MITSENIGEMLHDQPFEPFDIKTSDGRIYTVDHPDFLMRSRKGNVVRYTTDDDQVVTIALNQIVVMEVIKP